MKTITLSRKEHDEKVWRAPGTLIGIQLTVRGPRPTDRSYCCEVALAVVKTSAQPLSSLYEISGRLRWIKTAFAIGVVALIEL